MSRLRRRLLRAVTARRHAARRLPRLVPSVAGPVLVAPRVAVVGNRGAQPPRTSTGIAQCATSWFTARAANQLARRRTGARSTPTCLSLLRVRRTRGNMLGLHAFIANFPSAAQRAPLCMRGPANGARGRSPLAARAPVPLATAAHRVRPRRLPLRSRPSSGRNALLVTLVFVRSVRISRPRWPATAGKPASGLRRRARSPHRRRRLPPLRSVGDPPLRAAAVRRSPRRRRRLLPLLFFITDVEFFFTKMSNF
jgi:hypothetical protein